MRHAGCPLARLRSPSNPRSAEIVARRVRAARRATTGPAASRTGARSVVVLSVISGVLLMRRVVGARALDERDADHLVELLEAVFGAVSTPG